MGLQVKRTGSTDYGFYVKALVCGEPGTGKTLTASTWPNPIYANAEGGLMSIASRDIPTVDITSSGVMLDLKNALSQSPEVREKMLGVPVDTVVIDTIDEVARLLVKERLEQGNKDAMAIADWGWLGEQLRSMVRAYRNLPMNVIFNCHLKSVEDADSGTQFFKPAIQGAMGDEIAGYVDIAGVLTARPITEVINGKNHRRIVRILQTFPDVKRPWIKDRSGKLPMEFPVNFEDDYKRLHELIYGDVVDHQPEVQQTIVQPAEETGERETGETGKPQVPAGVPDAGRVVESVVEKVKEAAAVVTEAPKKRGRPKKDEGKDAPEPEPSAPESDPAPSEPEVATPEVENVPVPTEVSSGPTADAVQEMTQESVPAPETPEKAAWETCESCGGQVESQDQAELAKLRFRKHLCRGCFATARQR